jgi:hypothetical protein
VASEVGVIIAMIGVAELLAYFAVNTDKEHNAFKLFLFFMSFSCLLVISNFALKISVGQTYESAVRIFYQVTLWLDVIFITYITFSFIYALFTWKGWIKTAGKNE